MESIEQFSTEVVKVSKNADGIAVLELNRPQKRNAFTQVMIDDIVAALAYLDTLGDVRALVVTSTPGSAFCGKSPDDDQEGEPT